MKIMRKALGWLLLVFGSVALMALWMPSKFWVYGWQTGLLYAFAGAVAVIVGGFIGMGFVMLIFWLLKD